MPFCGSTLLRVQIGLVNVKVNRIQYISAGNIFAQDFLCRVFAELFPVAFACGGDIPKCLLRNLSVLSLCGIECINGLCEVGFLLLKIGLQIRYSVLQSSNLILQWSKRRKNYFLSILIAFKNFGDIAVKSNCLVVKIGFYWRSVAVLINAACKQRIVVVVFVGQILVLLRQVLNFSVLILQRLYALVVLCNQFFLLRQDIRKFCSNGFVFIVCGLGGRAKIAHPSGHRLCARTDERVQNGGCNALYVAARKNSRGQRGLCRSLCRSLHCVCRRAKSRHVLDGVIDGLHQAGCQGSSKATSEQRINWISAGQQGRCSRNNCAAGCLTGNAAHSIRNRLAHKALGAAAQDGFRNG